MLILEQDIKQTSSEIFNAMIEEEVEAINALYEALKEKDVDKIDELFKALIQEMETNFKAQESMMEDAGYADAGLHQKDHDAMRAKLEKFLKRWEVLKGPKELRGFFDKDFKKWWTMHLSRWDLKTAIEIGG
jgi:hemerythrin-like metal-binding protein